MPFVWDIHTGEPDLVKDDPVAQFSFGLLAAMEQREIKGEKPWKWDGYVQSGSATHFRDGIEGLGATDPDERLDVLVRRYREKLIQQVRAGRIWADISEVNRIKGLLSNRDGAKLAATGFLLYSNARHRKDTLLLQSLFADVLWGKKGAKSQLGTLLDEEPSKELQSYLNRMGRAISESVSPEGLHEEALKIISEIDQVNVKGLGLYLRKCDNRAFLLVATVVCLWLDRRFSKEKSTTHASIKKAAGITNDHTISDNLKELGMNHTGQEFVNSLSRDLLPQPFWAVGDMHWRKREQEARIKRARPECIREQSAEAANNE